MCVGHEPCKIYAVWDEIDEKTTKICTRRLAQIQALFGRISPLNIRRLRNERQEPHLDLDECGSCKGVPNCEMMLVWDVVNEKRIQMCSRLQRKMLPLYGEPNEVELVTDPACDNFRCAVYAHDGGYFMGEFCTVCESKIQGERSPGIKASSIVLCRNCFAETDDLVLEQQIETTIEGVDKDGEDVSLTIPPLQWTLLRVTSELTVPEIIREFNHAAKWNQRIVDMLWQRLQDLTLCSVD